MNESTLPDRDYHIRMRRALLDEAMLFDTQAKLARSKAKLHGIMGGLLRADDPTRTTIATDVKQVDELRRII